MRHQNKPLIKDYVSRAAVAIDVPHWRVHKGEMFSASVTDDDLDTAAVLSISFTTSAKDCHVFASAFASASARWQILEAGTFVIGGGSNLAVLNRHRGKTNATSFIKDAGSTVNQFTKNGTLGGGPVILEDVYMGADKKGAPAESRGEVEWVLAPNTAYSFLLTATSDNNLASIRLSWYEA